jgi:cation diffusion facilitator CzcD-associated flavoprotein CzcO
MYGLKVVIIGAGIGGLNRGMKSKSTSERRNFAPVVLAFRSGQMG